MSTRAILTYYYKTQCTILGTWQYT